MKISAQRRKDTDGNPAPIMDNGRVYPYIGHALKDDGTPIITVWGETMKEVMIELTNHCKGS
jgi:hypothetical protein